MAPGIAVKGRNADEAVNPRFGAQIAIRIRALYGEGGVLQPTSFCRQVLNKVGGKAAPLCPAQVEAEQHIGPVLGFESSGTGMQTYDGIVAVVLTAEEVAHFGRADGLLKLGQRAFDLTGRLGVARLGHVKEDHGIGEGLLVLFPGVNRLTQRGAFFEDGLGSVLIVPEVIGGGEFFEPGGTGLFDGNVKDASRVCPPGSGVQSVFP